MAEVLVEAVLRGVGNTFRRVKERRSVVSHGAAFREGYSLGDTGRRRAELVDQGVRVAHPECVARSDEIAHSVLRSRDVRWLEWCTDADRDGGRFFHIVVVLRDQHGLLDRMSHDPEDDRHDETGVPAIFQLHLDTLDESEVFEATDSVWDVIGLVDVETRTDVRVSRLQPARLEDGFLQARDGHAAVVATHAFAVFGATREETEPLLQ